MSSQTIPDVKAFFGKLEQFPEGKKELGFIVHTLQFKMTDGAPFYVEIKDGHADVREGELPNPNPEKVTTIESDTQTLYDVMTGRLKPFRTFLTQRWVIDRRLAKFVIHSWIYRMFRIGQEIR